MSNVWVKLPSLVVNATEIATVANNSFIRMDHGTSQGVPLYRRDVSGTEEMTESLLDQIAIASTTPGACIVEFDGQSNRWTHRRLGHQ
ncbi:hypothetical protein [Arthrobacter sp. HY1533]|uniref:hypothetical protein n=1 Tax=Arthrobacter sp. HY1533 TaxID=2970919 RepID=UPI0022BA095E|nr:hypothetical protein [Arthrobacter sp. HY1533]